MALKLGELQVDIGADTSDLKRAGKEVKRTAGSMEKSFKRVGSAIVAALSFQAIKSVVLLADNMKLLDSRIRGLTKSVKGFREIRTGIRNIARDTGASITSVTELTQRALIAKEALGATNEQILEMVNNVQKLGAIGGTAQADLARASVQLGQALGAPRVQAEELNSILDATPLLAKEIEKNLGLLPGTLKQAVVAGKVLNTDIFQALIKSTDDINKRFEELPLTIDRAGGMIANAFAVAVQELDNGLGITEAIAQVMKDLSEVVESDLVPSIDAVVDEFSEFLFMLDSSTSQTQALADETFDLGRSWEIIKNSITFIWDAIKTLPANIRDITFIVVGELSQAWIKVKSNFLIFTKILEFSLVNAVDSAIGKMKKSFADFIGTSQSLLAQLLLSFGQTDLAVKLIAASAETISAGNQLNEALTLQQEARLALLEEELAIIDESTIIKIQASQSVIQAELDETQVLKEQAVARRKIREQERKDARNKAAGIEKTGKKIVSDDKKNKDGLNFNLDDAQKTTSSLEQSGLVDSRTAASAQIGISAGKAIAKTSELGFPAAIPFIAQALATIATARSAIKGGGRQTGGNVSQGVMHPVNENGQPELLVQGSKQFLLSGQSGGQIIPATSMRGGGSGGLNVTVNNNAPDLVTVSEPFVTQGELMIAIERASSQAVDQVNTSLSSGRGETFDSLRQGTSITRSI